MTTLERVRAEFASKKVAVLGLGREGAALARFFADLGIPLLLSDDKKLAELGPEVQTLARTGVTVKDGGLSDEAASCDVCFVSPGIPLTHPVVQKVVEAGAELWNEPRLFLRYCPASTVLAVTGSNGKSTTASLIAAMIEASARKVYLGGNIGKPLIGELAKIDENDAVVLELSSFQLQLFHESPPVAVITNITPNHLDRHTDMAEYIAAKTNIFRFQDDKGLVVLNADQDVSEELARLAPGRTVWFSCLGLVSEGAWLAGDELRLSNGRKLCLASELRLRGTHNIANALAAAAACSSFGVPEQAIVQALKSFPGLAHRLEFVDCIDGVSWFNDSIATTPERAIAALHSFSEPVVLLAGGRDKHLPWERWVQEVVAHAAAVVTFGEAGEMLASFLAGQGMTVRRARGLADAVQQARSLAMPGSVVLLSPGCASYDEFRDFEARGEAFRMLVRNLRP